MHVSQMRVRTVLGAVVMSALVVGNARAADRFVSTTGSDTANDCLSSLSPCHTVGYALAQAASGDTVKVAGGNYLENLSITTATTLILSGGWAGDFSVQDPTATPTVLTAATQLPGVTILANGITIGLTADGLTIQDGKNLPDGVGPPCRQGFGGGICAQVSAGGSLSLALSRVVLQRNLANRLGGGLHVLGLDLGSSLNLTVTNSTVTRNVAPQGAGIHIDADDKATVNATLDQVLFMRNRGAGSQRRATYGGGLSVGIAPTGQNVQVLVQNSIFDGNKANRGAGGGLFAWNTGCTMGSCPLNVMNSVFIHNHASVGGGIGVFNSSSGGGGAEIVNVTATMNTANFRKGDGGGGVFIFTGSIRNSILWGNHGIRPRDLRTFSDVMLDHSDVGEMRGPIADLGGNISSDPLFALRDIHLSASSPAIDTGTCDGAPTTDIDGDPRPTGAGCDMGADEFVP